MPNWLTALLALSLPVSTLVGVWLGSWMNQRGAEKLSKQTLDGQQLLANDAALREWRRQQVAPYLEAANRRVQFFLELALEVGNAEAAEAASGKPDLLAERPKLSRLLDEMGDSSSYFGLHLTGAAIPDKTFRDAFKQFFDAEKVDASVINYSSAEIRQIAERMVVALATLNTAAEHYIFSPQ